MATTDSPASVPHNALDRQVGGDHYKNMKIQPVEFIHANGIGFFEGNVIKYVSRWRAKNGLADLEKARHYLDLLIDLERPRNPAINAAAGQHAQYGAFNSVAGALFGSNWKP